MKRRPANRYASKSPHRPASIYRAPQRRARHENGGEFDGENKGTSLADFMRVIHKVPDRRKVDE